MKPLLMGLLLLCCTGILKAQSPSVHGKVADTLEKKALPHAVVALIRKSDSSLVRFSRTDRNGSFRMNGIEPGNYQILVTYPKFADYTDDIQVKADGETALGTLPLTLKSKLLQEVVVRTGSAIRIKGDTTEYAADSFVVREGATVEDLLKKLPGFQVNSKGEIVAQGQRVSKVLVDGEEFFGDDPTMATQNLSAKAVDKVQVFDTKSEQQNLTGMTTGNEGKTVNIKLKEDKKKGAFGRGELGYNGGSLLNSKALYNNFIGKRKISVYGTKSSTSTGSLNWEERRQMGIENDMEYDEISGYYFSFGNDDGFNDWSLRGLPNSYTAGGLYINRWDADKKALNSSYRYNRLGTENVGNNVVQNILPGSTLYNSTRTLSSGLNQQHAANARYEWKLDSLTSFKLTTTGTMKRTTYEDSTFFSALNGKNELLNNTRRYTERLNDRLQSDNQLQYKQLFKKKNRQLLATFRFGYTEDDLSGLNYAQIRTYEGGVVDQDSIVDQQRRFNGHSVTWGGKVTYTEPLNAKWSIVTEYSHNDNSSKSVKESFNKSNNGKYETLDPQFSNRFELDVASNGGILIGKYFTKKVKFAFGSGLSAVKLNLFNIDSQARKVYNFRNITPQASFGYMLKQNSNISFNYRGTTRQPTIDQLQPFRDNTDPNNLFIGNPDLKVSFTHNISMFYNSYKVLTGRGIWINASYNVTENAITNENNFDVATGKRTYRPVNVDGNKNIWYWAEWNHGEGEKKWIHTVRTSGNGGRYNNFVQGQKVRTDYATFEFGYGIRYEVSEKYSIHISPEGGYNLSNSSLKTPINNNYFSYGGRVEGKLNLTKKLELWSETNFELREKFKLPDNFSFPGLNLRQNIILWNAHLSYQVFKDKSGKIFLSANDLLNQNQGFSRQITSNMISEDRYQRIARYVMLRFEWTFNKMPGQK